MPILDPSLQYSLSSFDLRGSNTRINFFLTYLKIASQNINRNYNTLKSSIQFKNDLNKSYSILNSLFSCSFYVDDFDHSLLTNAYQYLLHHIMSKNPKKNAINNYFTYNGNYNINFCVPFTDSSHTWFLTDSPIAILSYHPKNVEQENNESNNLKSEDVIKNDIQSIIFEIDLLLASGFTIVLCILGSPDVVVQLKYFITSTINTYCFAEIHFNLEFDIKTYDSGQYNAILDMINRLNDFQNQGYFYLYTPFMEDYSKLSETKKIPFIKVFRFSQSLKKSLKNTENSFTQIKPFAYCETGFDFDKMRVVLCNVPLYKKENDIMPIEDSDITYGYIQVEDFLKWKGVRVPIILNDKNDRHNYVSYFIEFEDLHVIKPAFYVKKTLYLTKTSQETLKIIDDIVKERKPVNTEEENKNAIQIELEYVIQKLYEHKRSQRSYKNFTLHESQIFTVFDACCKCINEEDINQYFKSKKTKEKKESPKKPGILYQVETGEGKSLIILLISAVLSRVLKDKTIHIVSSNISLSKRDYEDSYEFIKLLDLKSSVLLHYNELPKEGTNERNRYYSHKYYEKEQFENSLRMNYNTLISDTKEKVNIVFSTFVNFESFYMRMMETSPEKMNDYFNECSLIVDEADAILIDEITNGTILSCPVNSNVEDVLLFVYKKYLEKVGEEELLGQIKSQWPSSNDLSIDDLKRMYKEIDAIQQDEYTNGKKYSIKTVNLTKQNKHEKFQKLFDSFKKINEYIDPTTKYGEKVKDNLVYQKVVPFDYLNKGVFEPNKEFPGFIQQFIAIKEMIDKRRETIKIKNISMNYLYISHPIFVKMYERVCAFTGTAGDKNCRYLYSKHYNINSEKISRNKPNRRIDLPIILCNNNAERDQLILNDIIIFAQKGFPVLVIFQDLIQIEEMFKKLQDKGFLNIQKYNGSDENFRPDEKGGRIGAISLGSNFCGRGTNIKATGKPLHVIVTYYSTNKRVMNQVLGRTARQGQQGTTQIICLKDEYIKEIEIFEQESIKKVLNVYQVNNKYQNQYIEMFRKSRKWIFDENPEPIKKQQYKKQLDKMRKAVINVNRFVACNFKFPVCMSCETFLEIQAQKIFSLVNCPNSKYTWILFQRYVREMILESWSLFIDKAEKNYQNKGSGKNKIKKNANNSRKNNSMKYDYDTYIRLKTSDLFNIVSQYIPIVRNKNKEDADIFPTFMHIFNLVVKKYQEPIFRSCSYFQHDQLKDNYSSGSFKKMIFFGFKPFTLMSVSGAKIASFDAEDDNNYVIKDPELIYIEKTNTNKKVLFSITRKIDGIFNKMCNKINEIISTNIGFKFFLRRTLCGCEFGLCFDMDLAENEEKSEIGPNCIIDKDPLLLLSINVKSDFPILAGILIIILVYIAKIVKNIVEWAGATLVKFSKEVAKLVIKDIITTFFNDQVNEALGKACSFLKSVVDKQISKIEKYNKDSKFVKLAKLLIGVIYTKSYDFEAEKIQALFENKFKIKTNSKIAKFLFSNLPIASLIKVGLLLMICIASFVLNFKNKKSLKSAASDYEKEYDKLSEDENINFLANKYDNTSQTLKVIDDILIKKSKENVFESLSMVNPSVINMSFPSNIKKICEFAFINCRNLKTVNFDKNTSLSIIGKYAFTRSSIEKIIIPKSVTIIEESAFSECSKLKSIQFEENSKLEKIEKDAFKGTLIDRIEIPENVYSIDHSLFDNISYLKFVSIRNNDSFTDIDNKMVATKTKEKFFDDLIFACHDIENVTIPSNICTISTNAFSSCYHIKSFKFEPNSKLNLIGIKSFNTSTITSITIPCNVTKIDQNAFYKCKKLKFVQFEANSKLEAIKEAAFRETAIESIIIPKNVKSIHKKAFLQCRQLKSIIFEENSKLNIIGESSFSETKITEIIIPSSVRKIDKSAFYQCSMLKSIKYGDKPLLLKIGKLAFSGTLINEITIHKKVREIDEGLLNSIDNLERIFVSKRNKYFAVSNDNKVFLTKVYEKKEDENAKTKLKEEEDDDDDDDEELKGIYVSFACHNVVNVTIPSKVTKISSLSFTGCNGIKSIKFEENSNLKIIDYKAFNCSSISKIKIPSSVVQIRNEAFADCTKLKSVEFDEDSKLSFIESSAFINTSLHEIVIPISTTHIGKNAFAHCKQLESVEFLPLSCLTVISDYAFTDTSIKSINVPSDVVQIGEGAFLNCTALKTVTFKDSRLETIGKCAFKGTKIEEIEIPSTVTKIMEGCFENCINFKYIEIAENSVLQTIGKNAFKETKIIEIMIPSEVVEIGESAFSDCKNLKSVQFEENSKLKYIRKEAFCGTALTEIVIQKNVIEIGDGSFANCNKLKDLLFEENLDPDPVQVEIGSMAFSKTRLASISFPKNVSYIGSGAFSGISEHLEIKFDPIDPPSLGIDVFKDSFIKKLS